MLLNEKMLLVGDGCRAWHQKVRYWGIWGVLALMLWGCQGSEAEKWAKQLRSPDAKAREEAAQKLQQLGPKAEDAVPALVGALADKEKRVVVASVRALRAIGPRAFPARPALIGLFKKSDKAMKQEVSLALQAISQRKRRTRKPPPPIPQLLGVLEKEKDPKKYAMALVQLAEHREKALPHVQKLVDGLDHKEKEVRRAASAAISVLGPKLALPVLRKNIHHKSARLRNNVIRTIGLFGPYALDAQDDLLKAATDKDPKIRRAALWALGNLGPKSAQKSLSVVKQALKDPEWLVRGAACTAYGNLMRGAKEAFPVLRELLKDQHAHVRYMALEHLLRFGPQVKPALDAALKDAEPEVRALALQGGASLRLFDGKVLPDLLAATKDKTWQVRVAAVQAIGTLGSDAKSALPQLQKLMSDSNIRVRRTVLQVFLAVQQAKKGAARVEPPRPPVAPMPTPRGTNAPSSAPTQRRP